ncbi:hypothetical protein [Metallibacterium sp.]|uniref:hypothetical protein n=1 Tax=Metallibacterium sp. TaxID=2940281 RepID=UPI00262CC385|nr:hypothetical protein [Metallibacterium sp.]
MHPNLNSLARALALALSFTSAATLAQAAPAGAGNFPVITVPPPPMSAVSNPPTPGADSTLWSNGIPGPQNSSITIPLPTSPGGGGGGPPPVSCTPSNYGQSLPAQCPAGETVGGITGGQTVFTQSRQIAVTCPAGPYGAPVTTATAWTPPVASECAIPQNGGGNHTCSVSCPVTCRVSVAGFSRNYTGYWASGGGAGCPAAGTPNGEFASNPGSTPSFCSGTLTYTYTSTSSCPVPTSGGNSGCTLAQVNAGTCATCSRTCGSTASGFATCQTHNINATTCSYWGYSGSSCPTGATGGNWRAGLCP